MAFQFKTSIVGGTFDRLHRGHKDLLDAAFSQSEKVIVGVATQKLHANKPLASLIEDFKAREDAVISYLTEKGFMPHAEIIPIDDVYGNSLTEKDIQAIFVTESNCAVVNGINDQRKKIGFPALEIIEIPLHGATDGKEISSERIRKGEIDREGNAYLALFANEKYTLPESNREALRHPFGAVHEDVQAILDAHKDAQFIAVGDVVSLSFYKLDQQASVSIVDLKTRRAHIPEADIDIFYSMESLKAAMNAAGSIDRNAVNLIKESLQTFETTKELQTLVIAGEEDLLTIPAILLAPLGAIVVYGQFETGAIAVEVTEEKKKEVAALFRTFS